MNILVVDDTRIILEAIADFLELEGYNPILASSAVEGINLLKQVDIAIVISDMEMGPINGFDFALNVRSINANIPIIFFSPEKDSATRYKAELDLIDNCTVIYKHQPSSFVELLDAIKNYQLA